VLNRILAAAALIALAACRYHPTPVVLQGEQEDIHALAGNWSGEYASDQTGRSGSIVFKVDTMTQADSAFGDVVMTPTAGNAIMAADAASGEHRIHSASATLLTIRFVNAAGGEVQGMLEPYLAPDCQCVVRTQFRGVVSRDKVSGIYTTFGPNGLRQEGRWSVTRTP
jgi:hypothetical protein